MLPRVGIISELCVSNQKEWKIMFSNAIVESENVNLNLKKR